MSVSTDNTMVAEEIRVANMRLTGFLRRRAALSSDAPFNPDVDWQDDEASDGDHGYQRQTLALWEQEGHRERVLVALNHARDAGLVSAEDRRLAQAPLCTRDLWRIKAVLSAAEKAARGD